MAAQSNPVTGEWVNRQNTRPFVPRARRGGGNRAGCRPVSNIWSRLFYPLDPFLGVPLLVKTTIARQPPTGGFQSVTFSTSSPSNIAPSTGIALTNFVASRPAENRTLIFISSLPKSNANAPAIWLDELDPGTLESGADRGFSTVRGIQRPRALCPLDSRNRHLSGLCHLTLGPPEKRSRRAQLIACHFPVDPFGSSVHIDLKGS